MTHYLKAINGNLPTNTNIDGNNALKPTSHYIRLLGFNSPYLNATEDHHLVDDVHLQELDLLINNSYKGDSAFELSLHAPLEIIIDTNGSLVTLGDSERVSVQEGDKIILPQNGTVYTPEDIERFHVYEVMKAQPKQ